MTLKHSLCLLSSDLVVSSRRGGGRKMQFATSAPRDPELSSVAEGNGSEDRQDACVMFSLLQS